MKRIISLFAIMLLLATACRKHTGTPTTAPAAPGNQARPVTAEACIVSSESLEESLRLPGTLQPAEQVSLHAEINGIISQIDFSDGQRVSKGQLLVRLRDDEPAARLSKLKVQEEILRLSEQRQADLLKAGASGKTEYDNALLAYRSIQADIRIAEAELRKYSITAPFSGMLGRRMVSPGDLIGAGTAIASLTQNEPLKLSFAVPEKYSGRVRMNSTVEFLTDGGSGSHRATIRFIAPYVNDENKNLEVMAVVTKGAADLKPGAYATVVLDLSKKANSLLIPGQCIIPGIKDKQVALYRGGLVRFSTVDIGYRDSARVEIISGISAGDTVLTTGIMKLKPGMPVSLSKINQGL